MYLKSKRYIDSSKTNKFKGIKKNIIDFCDLNLIDKFCNNLFFFY